MRHRHVQLLIEQQWLICVVDVLFLLVDLCLSTLFIHSVRLQMTNVDTRRQEQRPMDTVEHVHRPELHQLIAVDTHFHQQKPIEMNCVELKMEVVDVQW